MKKYKNIIYIVLAVIIIGVLIYFVYIPQIKSSLVLWVKNSLKQTQISNLEKEKADLNNLKQQEKEVENLSNALTALVPDKKDTGGFMIEIEALASDTGVSLSDIKFSQEQKTASQAAATETTGKATNVKGVSDSTKFKETIYEIAIKGGYPQVISFLKGFENSKRAVSIEKADLNEVQGVIQANLKGKIYYTND